MSFDIDLSSGGRCFFASDIHGNYSMLVEALKQIGFNFPTIKSPKSKHDYLFLIGDLVDRGDQCLELLQFVRHNPSVFAVRGNHEKMAYDGLTGSMSQYSSWMVNGGEWANDIDRFVLRDYLRWANHLPDLMEVNINGEHKIGLAHASVPDDLSWAELKSKVSLRSYLSYEDNKAMFQRLLWNRTSVRDAEDYTVHGIDAVLHGHTVNDGQIVELGNRLYIDTGCGFMGEQYGLTILEYKPESQLLGLFDVYRFEKDPWTGRIEMV